MSAPAVFGPFTDPCASCNADAGEPCRPWCVGAGLTADEHERAARVMVRRGVLVLCFVTAALVGACAPLWDAMPWAVTP